MQGKMRARGGDPPNAGISSESPSYSGKVTCRRSIVIPLHAGGFTQPERWRCSSERLRLRFIGRKRLVSAIIQLLDDGYSNLVAGFYTVRFAPGCAWWYKTVSQSLKIVAKERNVGLWLSSASSSAPLYLFDIYYHLFISNSHQLYLCIHQCFLS